MVKQNKTHATIDEGEFVRPVRDKYIHDKCGVETKMGWKIAETYARKPKFYTHTYCVGCEDYFPVGEFKWSDSTEVLGS